VTWYIKTPDGEVHDAAECKAVMLEPANDREHSWNEIYAAFRSSPPSLWLLLANVVPTISALATRRVEPEHEEVAP